MTETINFLIVLFGVTVLLISLVSRIESFIKILSFQGFLLFLIVAAGLGEIRPLDFGVLFVETVAVKTVLIPLFLLRIVRHNEIYREVEPGISHFNSLLVATFLTAFGLFMAWWSLGAAQGIKPLHFGISVSTLLVGLFVIISRKKIITHVLGYVVIENGIFLLSLSVAATLPRVVEFGILLDLFLVVYIFGIFVNRIRSTYDEIDIGTLTDLRD
jgi:hydrogenase-4 component E